jgi:hypothetical protein
MSRQVDIFNGPLSDEDRDYLLSRGRRHLVLQNERQFAEPSPAPQGSDDDDWADQVDELNVAELRDELLSRGLDASGNKDALKRRLLAAGPEEG